MSPPDGSATDLDRAVEPLESEHSLGELFARLGEHLGGLVSAQVELAREELSTEAKQAAQAAGMLGAGALLSYLTLTLLCFAAAWGLSEVMPAGLAFLVVAVVVGLVAAVTVVMGKQRVEAAREVAPKTMETLKEDAQWTRQQVK